MTADPADLDEDRSAARPAEDPVAPLSPLRVWVALLGLAVGAFLFVTLEFLPVGLLPQVANGLGVSQRTAGLLVTGHALCVVITTIPLTAALARVNRRWLLAALLTVLAGGAALAATAPSFAVLFAARLLVAMAQGVFWTMSAALAATVVGPQRVGRGIAIVFGGISLAQVVGVPLFTFIGEASSWRVAAGVLSVMAAVTAAVVLVALPDVPGLRGAVRTSLRPVLGNVRLLGATGVILVSFGAVYVTLTYFSPVVREMTGTPADAVPAFLLVFGIAGVAGNALAGALIDRQPGATLIGALGGVAVAAVLLAAGGGALPIAVLAIGIWGLCGSAFPTTFQTWALSLAPEQAENAGGLVVVAVNLGIALGALLGGALLSQGATTLIVTTATLLGVALLAVVLARRRRSTR